MPRFVTFVQLLSSQEGEKGGRKRGRIELRLEELKKEKAYTTVGQEKKPDGALFA